MKDASSRLVVALHVRSALFTPASNSARIEKALRSEADLVILDLEDGVGADQKSAARQEVVERLSDRECGAWAIRINHIATEDGLRDLLALGASPKKPAVVMLPKVESVTEIEIAHRHLSRGDDPILIVALIESARGMSRVDDIARHAAVGALGFGGADFARDIGAELAWEPMLLARSRIVQAAAGGSVVAWDAPSLSLRDANVIRAEAMSARALGFSGKLAIHPDQLSVINAAFSPSEEEIESAQRIVAAFDGASAGAVAVDGRMIDLPVVEAARRRLAAARPQRGASPT